MAISIRSVGAPIDGTNLINVPVPLGVTAGDMLVLPVVNKYPPHAASTPSGWTFNALLQVSGGHGLSGTDSGSVYVTVYTRISDGSEFGTVPVTVTLANSSLAVILCYKTTSPAGWAAVTAKTVAVNTVGSPWSATTASDLGLAAGDVALAVNGVNSDLFSYSAETLSCAGCTFSAAMERVDTSTTSGDDLALVVSEHGVTVGSSAGNQTFAMSTSGTTANSPAGGLVLIRLRESQNYTFAWDVAKFTVTRPPVTIVYSGATHATYVLENDQLRVTFAESDTYGVVLQSIENLRDPAKITFSPSSLFRLVMRAVAEADLFVTLQSENATNHFTQGVGYDEGFFHLGSSVEDPPLGGRKWFQSDFSFIDIGTSSDDLKVSFTAQILDNQPDRVLFAIYFDPTFGDRLVQGAVFWAAPILLAIPPYGSAHYYNPVNGGVVTRNPSVDLVGNGTTYRFKTAVGFEPETKTVTESDQMEVFYPQSASMALSAYGDRSAGAATVYLHDPLQFNPRRIVDGFSGGLIRLEHEGLVENAIYPGNLWTITDPCYLRAVQTYVRVFKRTGDFLGEDVALDYQKFLKTSAEGALVIPPRVRDREDMATLRDAPLYVTTYGTDDENENGTSEAIVKELRMALPNLGPLLPWVASGYTDLRGTPFETLNAWNANNTTGTHVSPVGDTMPDLYDLVVDPEKVSKAAGLLGSGTIRGGYTAARRPTPYDGASIWDLDDFDSMRVKNHLEAAKAGYRSTDRWLRFFPIVASTSFDGTFTKVTFTPGAPEASLWTIYSTYALTTAGINHAGHPDHLGWFGRSDGSYAYAVERINQADFLADPPSAYVAGDARAVILPGHVLVFQFVALQFIPGYDAGVPKASGDNAGTSLCSMADDIGSEADAPSVGWAIRFMERVSALMRSWGCVILNKFADQNPVCWATHSGETSGSNQQILGWRRVLAKIRSSFSLPFQWIELTGPFDWLVGFVDGFARTQVRMDLTTSNGSWGASALFRTAWAPYLRAGMFANKGSAHVTNLGNSTGTYATVYEGAGSRPVFREALVSDFLLGKLPTYAASPLPADAMGTRPDGAVAFTPFYHASFPMTTGTSYAALLARLVQFQLGFHAVNVDGQQLRSFHRLGGATISSKLQTLPNLDGHDLPATELGDNRAPLFHAAYLDDLAAPKLVTLFVNDQQTTVSETYKFTPSWYPDLFAVKSSGYSAAQFQVNYNGVVAMTLGLVAGTLSVTLGPGEVQALVITPTSPTTPAGTPCSADGTPVPPISSIPSSGLSGTAGTPAGSACSSSGT